MSNVTVSDVLYHFTGFGGTGKSDEQSFDTLLKIIKSSKLILNKNDIKWGYHDTEGNPASSVFSDCTWYVLRRHQLNSLEIILGHLVNSELVSKLTG